MLLSVEQPFGHLALHRFTYVNLMGHYVHLHTDVAHFFCASFKAKSKNLQSKHGRTFTYGKIVGGVNGHLSSKVGSGDGKNLGFV
jgi:hypothetical protein